MRFLSALLLSGAVVCAVYREGVPPGLNMIWIGALVSGGVLAAFKAIEQMIKK